MVVVLLGLLGASVWFAAQSWLSVDGPPMPTQGYIAMILGVVFSVVIGCGLMALVFYSNRYGYDEPAIAISTGRATMAAKRSSAAAKYRTRSASHPCSRRCVEPVSAFVYPLLAATGGMNRRAQRGRDYDDADHPAPERQQRA